MLKRFIISMNSQLSIIAIVQNMSGTMTPMLVFIYCVSIIQYAFLDIHD